MRVLLTGHQGYLGTVMAPVLQDAGHDVIGLDTGLFADCVLGPVPADPPGLAVDVRDVTEQPADDRHAGERAHQRPDPVRVADVGLGAGLGDRRRAVL